MRRVKFARRFLVGLSWFVALGSIGQAQDLHGSPAKPTAAVEAAPAACPAGWLGLLGIYGAGDGLILIRESEGSLEAGTPRGHFYALEALEPDRFRFPDVGRYADRKVTFLRDPSGKATALRLDAALVPRDEAAEGIVPRIAPGRPVADLLSDARAASAPVERGDPVRSDLADVATLDPTVKVDLRYAGGTNPLGVPLLRGSRALLQRPAAEAVVKAHRILLDQGYGVVVRDALHPWWVTKVLWEAAPVDQRSFFADPAGGSAYNRGTAVDVTLMRLADGQDCAMPSAYGEVSLRTYADFPGGSSEQRFYRDLLREAMASAGLRPQRSQWWRFDFPTGVRFPVVNSLPGE